MNDKQQILTVLREEFGQWEALLAGLSEAQLAAPDLPAELSLRELIEQRVTATHPPYNLSIKDVVAHLIAWQQRSIARAEAALLDQEPRFPGWPVALDPESDADLDPINVWIYETYREHSWPSVYRAWRDGFLRLLELGAAIPENDLLAPGRYPWLDGHPLALVFRASYEHHHDDHLEPLIAWLRRHHEWR